MASAPSFSCGGTIVGDPFACDGVVYSSVPAQSGRVVYEQGAQGCSVGCGDGAIVDSTHSEVTGDAREYDSTQASSNEPAEVSSTPPDVPDDEVATNPPRELPAELDSTTTDMPETEVSPVDENPLAGLEPDATDAELAPEPTTSTEEDLGLDFLNEDADATSDTTLEPAMTEPEPGVAAPEPAVTTPAPAPIEDDDNSLDFLDDTAEPANTPIVPDETPAPAVEEPLFSEPENDPANIPADPVPGDADPLNDDDFSDLFETEDAAPAPATDGDDEFEDLFKGTSVRPQTAPTLAESRPTFRINALMNQLGKLGAMVAVAAAEQPGTSVRKVGDASVRGWIDNTGKFSTQARLVEIGTNHVRLLKENGRFTTTPLRRLSDRDAKYVQSVAAELEGATATE